MIGIFNYLCSIGAVGWSALGKLWLQIKRKHHGYNNANTHLFHRFNAGGDCGCHSNWLTGGPEPWRRVCEEALYWLMTCLRMTDALPNPMIESTLKSWDSVWGADWVIKRLNGSVFVRRSIVCSPESINFVPHEATALGVSRKACRASCWGFGDEPVGREGLS